MNRIFQLPILIFILLFTHDNYLLCSESAKEILPLKIGNEWVENICRFGSYGDVNCHKRITKVIADTLIESEKYYVVEVCDSNGKVQSRNYYINKSDGLYSYIKYESVMILKYPVQKGDIFRGVTDTIKVDSMDVTLQLSDKSYKCIQYSVERTYKVSYKMFIYCSPGIGRILYEIYEIGDGKEELKERWELLEYKLK
ncbi:MAG: hypothetical protein EPN82_17005 [Bacteroidetes bacterium]|nr:MAG: hypothetical protein EPN82_17005 [Bacteroidota bacterium]